jgi:hypothetical protein
MLSDGVVKEPEPTVTLGGSKILDVEMECLEMPAALKAWKFLRTKERGRLAP